MALDFRSSRIRRRPRVHFFRIKKRGDPQAADADFFFTGLLPPDLDAVRDRFDLVEGLSGWNLNDILRGSNDDALTLGTDHALTAAGIARISGLAAILPTGATSFNAGNIILGGAGSDLPYSTAAPLPTNLEGSSRWRFADSNSKVEVTLPRASAPCWSMPSPRRHSKLTSLFRCRCIEDG